jgi:hypothetical protein
LKTGFLNLASATKAGDEDEKDDGENDESAHLWGRWGILDPAGNDHAGTPALAKIERGHAQDVGEVGEMLRRNLVGPAQL